MSGVSTQPEFTPTDSERDAGVEDVHDHGTWSADERDGLAFKAPCPRCDRLVAEAYRFCQWCGLENPHDIGYIGRWSE